MQVDLIFRVAAVGILVAVPNMLLARSGREEQALLVTIAGLLVVFSMLIGQIGSLFETIRRTFGL